MAELLRGYSAGGSALSFRGVIVYHSAGFCFIMPRGYHAGGFTSSFRGAYSQSCRAVLNHHAAVLIAYQEAGTWFR